MKLNKKTRLQIRIQSGLFLVLFIGLITILAWFSTQYSFSLDLTDNQRNSLSEPTQRLLQGIDQEVTIRAFVSPVNEIREMLDTLFQRYQDSQPLIKYENINPDLAPELLREFNIQRDGEVVIEVNGRSENLAQITESNVTNTLARLLRQGDRWIVFLEGHGERSPFGQANHDLQLYAARLSQKGFHIETTNLMQTTSIPDNTDVLVIADSASGLLPGELDMIQQYIKQGGNLLWLSDVREQNPLEPIAEYLELEFLPGVIVDPSTQILGLSRVDFALVADYPRHAITTAMNALTLFPQASAMIYHGEQSEWKAVPLLVTQSRSWNETGALKGEISQGDNDDELAGPLNIGYSLTRSLQSESGELQTQRIVVTGDADFLSNQYLGNGDNLSLGLNMINWLSHDDNLIAISPRSALDTQLELSPNSQLFIALLFLIILPVALLGSGIRIWLVRRKR